jgi:BRCT domain type II-containing protein
MKSAPTAKVPVQPTRANIKGMTVILYGEVKGKTRKEVIAELEALGAKVIRKPSAKANCALVGAEPKYSKALEREFLWKRKRVKSYGPKTLAALLTPASKVATRPANAAKATKSKPAKSAKSAGQVRQSKGGSSPRSPSQGS